MSIIPSRRLGVALLVGAIVFNLTTAFAASMTVSSTTAVGEGETTISAPCVGVSVATTNSYHAAGGAYGAAGYYVDTAVLTGDTCTGTTLTVQVTLKNGSTDPQFTAADPASGADLEAGVTIDVSGTPVRSHDLVGVAVLVTGQ
jgi:hypothetical protein